MFCNARKRLFRFHPRTPVRGATRAAARACAGRGISIHAPLCGVRLRPTNRAISATSFQSTHPCAGCDSSSSNHMMPMYPFQSTHPCAGCDLCAAAWTRTTRISIHAPLCGVRRLQEQIFVPAGDYFNPRTPVRGATNNRRRIRTKSHISIHAPLCGVRPAYSLQSQKQSLFQSTHPCAGCDVTIPDGFDLNAQFQSTHPCAGCDISQQVYYRYICHFNPRTPVRGATQNRPHGVSRYHHFNPRTPVRGATRAQGYYSQWAGISIHAPLCGVRLPTFFDAAACRAISIHAPLCGVRRVVGGSCHMRYVFQSTHPCAGCDYSVSPL